MSFEVDPEAIRASGGSLTATGSDFAERLAAFQQQAAAYDGAWGDDTIGTYIGTAYAAVSAWAFENWQTVADELAVAGDDLVTSADAYQQVEESVTAGLEAIAKRLG